MRAELVIRTLLTGASAVTSIVSTRMARARLPQNTAYPALVYDQVDGVPVPPINATAGGNLSRSRVQVTALARDLDTMDNLLEAVRVACSFQSGSISGVLVVAVTPDAVQPVLRDDDAAVFYQSIDFMVTHFES